MLFFIRCIILNFLRLRLDWDWILFIILLLEVLFRCWLKNGFLCFWKLVKLDQVLMVFRIIGLLVMVDVVIKVSVFIVVVSFFIGFFCVGLGFCKLWFWCFWWCLWLVCVRGCVWYKLVVLWFEWCFVVLCYRFRKLEFCFFWFLFVCYS